MSEISILKVIIYSDIIEWGGKEMGYSELRPVLLRVEWNERSKDKIFWSSHLSFVTNHWFNFHMYSISHKSKGTSLTHLSFKVKGRIKYMHIKYFINKSQKYNHSNRHSELQHMLVFSYGLLPFRKRALFLKAMIFLRTYGNSMHSSTNKKPNIWCIKRRGRRKWAV